jgi:hypothetical protein
MTEAHACAYCAPAPHLANQLIMQPGRRASSLVRFRQPRQLAAQRARAPAYSISLASCGELNASASPTAYPNKKQPSAAGCYARAPSWLPDWDYSASGPGRTSRAGAAWRRLRRHPLPPPLLLRALLQVGRHGLPVVAQHHLDVACGKSRRRLRQIPHVLLLVHLIHQAAHVARTQNIPVTRPGGCSSLAFKQHMLLGVHRRRAAARAEPLRVGHRTSTALQVGLDRDAAQAHLSQGALLGQRGQGSHLSRDGQLIMLSTIASLHHVSGVLAEVPSVATVITRRARVGVQFSTEGLLGRRHHRCDINLLALQHVRRPARVGAHKLQGSAQLGRQHVGAAAAQARSNVGHKGAAVRP